MKLFFVSSDNKFCVPTTVQVLAVAGRCRCWSERRFVTSCTQSNSGCLLFVNTGEVTRTNSVSKRSRNSMVTGAVFHQSLASISWWRSLKPQAVSWISMRAAERCPIGQCRMSKHVYLLHRTNLYGSCPKKVASPTRPASGWWRKWEAVFQPKNNPNASNWCVQKQRDFV